MDGATSAGHDIMLSPISLAEIIYLVEKNRLPASAYWHSAARADLVSYWQADYVMDAKIYLKVSAMNFVFLAAGILIGSVVTNSHPILRIVHAQGKDKQAAKLDAAPFLDPNAEYVSPSMSMGGPVVTNTLLANKIACDHLQVNGFDPLRLNDAILSLLARKGIATAADVQAIVQTGRADHPLRVKPQ